MDYVTRLMATARIHLTGAVDDAIKLGIFQTIDEFCRETNIWQESLDFETVEGTDVVYDLVPTLGTILRLMYVRQGDIPARGIMQIPGELVLPNVYTPQTPITAVVSLAPIDPVEADTNFPIMADWMWHRFFPAFEDGLILKMAATPDKPYTDANLASYHGRRWRNAISVARADAVKWNVANGQSWRFPAFAVQSGSSTQVN